MENYKDNIQKVLGSFKSKDFDKAEYLCKKIINKYPNYSFTYNLMGLILTEKKKYDEAIKIYELGLKINPKYGMIYNNLGSIYNVNNDYKKSEECFLKSIELDKNIAEPHNNLGNLYLSLNKIDKSITCFKKAININENFVISHFNLGVVYKSIGKFTESKKHLSKAIDLNPKFYVAHRTLSQITKYTKETEHFKKLNSIYNSNDALPKTHALFALGKAHEDIKDFSKAFKYFEEGNNLRRKEINYIPEDEINEFQKIKEIFNKSFLEKCKGFGNKDKSAIFILGMPRSGTTLVEQILSNHKKVYGGDELNFIPKLIHNNSIFNKKFDLNKITELDKKKYHYIGSEYINKTKKISNNSKIITDKLPVNFKWIGFIKLILPNAKIIHCKRNSKDTCLSIYKNYFTNPQLNFSYKLNEIVEYYKQYLDLMNHWKNTLHEFIYDIEYENLLNDSKKEIKSLLKHCELDWDKNCLEFYNNKRPIKTASDAQARSKFYKTSLNSWKNYEIFLKDAFKNLTN